MRSWAVTLEIARKREMRERETILAVGLGNGIHNSRFSGVIYTRGEADHYEVCITSLTT